MRKFLAILVIAILCLIAVDFARFSAQRMHNANSAYIRGRTHLTALRAYVKEHGEFPDVMLSAESRSEFLCYAGDRFDSPTKKVTSPQYVFPLYNADGEWLASPTEGRNQSAPVFVRMLPGVPGNSVIIIRESGPILRNESGDQKVSLQNKELILYSGETRSVPESLTSRETSQFILNLKFELKLNRNYSPTQVAKEK